MRSPLEYVVVQRAPPNTPTSRTSATTRPVSSHASRTAASEGVSSGSTIPPGVVHTSPSMCLTSSTRSRSSNTMTLAVGTSSCVVPTIARSERTYSDIGIFQAPRMLRCRFAMDVSYSDSLDFRVRPADCPQRGTRDEAPMDRVRKRFRGMSQRVDHDATLPNPVLPGNGLPVACERLRHEQWLHRLREVEITVNLVGNFESRQTSHDRIGDVRGLDCDAAYWRMARAAPLPRPAENSIPRRPVVETDDRGMQREQAAAPRQMGLECCPAGLG